MQKPIKYSTPPRKKLLKENKVARLIQHSFKTRTGTTGYLDSKNVTFLHTI